MRIQGMMPQNSPVMFGKRRVSTTAGMAAGAALLALVAGNDASPIPPVVTKTNIHQNVRVSESAVPPTPLELKFRELAALLEDEQQGKTHISSDEKDKINADVMETMRHYVGQLTPEETVAVVKVWRMLEPVSNNLAQAPVPGTHPFVISDDRPSLRFNERFRFEDSQGSVWEVSTPQHETDGPKRR